MFKSLLLALVLCLGATTASAQTNSRQVKHLNQAINTTRQNVWHWQRVLGLPLTHAATRPEQIKSPAYRRYVARLWRARWHRLQTRVQRPPRQSEWLCIHDGRGARWGVGEGSWTANTGNGYYGGLQMDLSFQRSYGGYLLKSKGTANHWTPLEQIWVAERAYKSGRGYYPWPNTARACGLI